MRTHTIRKSKISDQRILTFSDKFVVELLQVHPWAARQFIGTLLKEVKCGLDYDQDVKLEQLINPIPEITYEQHMALKWLSSGLRMLDADLQDILKILDFAAKKIFDEGTK